jgi:catechol 2,3-dioxygenase-like lactoylglutathione lyase family enzyme
MTLSLRKVNVINLFAEDFTQTGAFYQDILGLPLLFSNENHAVFQTDSVIVSLWDASAAPELIAPAGLANPQAGSRFVIAVSVDDVKTTCGELAQRGVELLNGPVDRSWGVRTASFSDPAGHIWEISEDLD